MSNFSKPCAECTKGVHEKCQGGLCGCIRPHSDDSDVMRGFKALKRQMHPERASWTRD